MIPFEVQKLDESATLPTRRNPEDAGIDIYTNESYTLQPGEVHAFSTGLAAAIPSGYVALLWDRSGLGSKGIHRLAGVIDAGYRGEWRVVLINLTNSPYAVNAGDKIIQCVVQKFEAADVREVDVLSNSSRGGKGFGSSGR